MLIKLEEIASQVRTACKDFMEYLELEREEVFLLLKEIEEISLPDEASTRRVLKCRSLVYFYQDQVQMEEETHYEIISSLSQWYSEEMNIESKIAAWIKILDSRILMKKPHWKGALHTLYGSGENILKMSETATMVKVPPLIQKSAMIRSDNIHIFSSTSVVDHIDEFLDIPEPGTHSILIHGSHGSGKSYLCDQLERKALAGHVNIIRPSLPLDLMGSRVGEAEDTLLAIFGAATSEKSVLILDDMEHILGEKERDQKASLTSRLRSTFLAMMDTVKLMSPDLLIVCTSTRKLDLNRFGTTITLSPPNDYERRYMIISCLSLQGLLNHTHKSSALLKAEQYLSEVVECTIGRSRAELSQLCRQTMTGSTGTPSHEYQLQQLVLLRQSLEVFAPESLRSGVVTEFVDMTVLTARDLSAASNIYPDLEIFGESAKRAWDQLEALIVMPLCRAKALDNILFGLGTIDANVVCGGVLLTGLPGVGKSAVARHAAAVAAYLVPSTKLLNVSCTSLVHKEVGGSEKAIRRLFEAARAAAPCILLMDGIENIAALRGHDNTTEGTMDRILSTLLTELDGVESNLKDERRIAIIGVTQNVDWIDPALRRPGRLTKVIQIDLPDHETRRKIVIKELQQSLGKAASNEIAEIIANQTDAKSGAEVIAICAGGRLNCIRDHIHSNKIGLPELKMCHFQNLSA